MIAYLVNIHVYITASVHPSLLPLFSCIIELSCWGWQVGVINYVYFWFAQLMRGGRRGGIIYNGHPPPSDTCSDYTKKPQQHKSVRS